MIRNETETIVKQLRGLGFSARLDRQVFLHQYLSPQGFTVWDRHRFGEEEVGYQLFFGRKTPDHPLRCTHYDAFLKKVISIDSKVIGGVDLAQLDRDMESIDWSEVFSDARNDVFEVGKPDTWEKEREIEPVFMGLAKLVEAQEGGWATLLKFKHWSQIMPSLFGKDLHTFRSRYELSQRFYLMNEDGITVREAYRFLRNRWMEQQFLSDRRKEKDVSSPGPKASRPEKRRKSKKDEPDGGS